MRKTEQRQAIRGVFERARRPLSAQEVLEVAQGVVPGLGIATVYRALKRLVDEGFLRPVDLPGEASRYERAGLHHHHHFQCEVCGRVFDVPGCPGGIEAMVPSGFELRRHELLLFGRCRECSAAPAGRA